MQRHEFTTADLEPFIVDSVVDTYLHVITGAGYLCIGNDMTTLETCSPVATGEKMVLPAGVNAAAAMSGGMMVIVTAPFGV